ncbi:TPA: hypothetical protein ACGUY0_003151 [Vibrio vulnificus]
MNIENSTLKGLALLGSVVAGFTGFGQLFSVDITHNGIELGGAIGVAVPALLGVYESIPDRFKPSKKVGRAHGKQSV